MRAVSPVMLRKSSQDYHLIIAQASSRPWPRRSLASATCWSRPAMAKSGLPRARLEGERMRTVNQLRLFAAEVRAGHWLEVTIDPALPDRTPPRDDLRRVNVALGPVAVFGASNFPLAFSVAGGDTAAAFAAGCPVVVEGHPAHPATGELVAVQLLDGAGAGLSGGVFRSCRAGPTPWARLWYAILRIRAVGFTGSRAGGLALARLAAERAEPIPVYAEMSSINPVVLMPHALDARAEALGAAFATSLLMGAGQFCTQSRARRRARRPGSRPLRGRWRGGAGDGGAGGDAHRGDPRCLHGRCRDARRPCRYPPRRQRPGRRWASTAAPAHCSTTAASFLADPALGTEVFGAASLIVRCGSLDELRHVLAGLEGQLTATIHLDPADEAEAAAILPLLRARAGQVLANGWPTGVEVTHAMVHGGPYPATTDSRSTSVGTLAMMRFLRPVCSRT